MKYLKPIVDDLRERRLWPVAVALLAGIIVVPVALSKTATPSPVPPREASVGGVAEPSTALPTVAVDNSVLRSRLHAQARDPFRQTGPSSPANSALTGAIRSASGSSSKGGSGTTGTSSAKSSATTGSGKTTTSGGSTKGTTPSPTIPVSPSPAPSGLGPAQVYEVALAMTNGSGGVDTTDPVTRLSPLPSRHQPLMVELGVLKGGKRVLFALLQNAVVSGPGTCTPGPIDCEILSLAPGQIESLATQSSSGVQPVTQFAVTAIKAQQYGSAAAATTARKNVSAAGQHLLRSAHLNAVSLFPYNVGLGSLVDIRNLNVGGKR